MNTHLKSLFLLNPEVAFLNFGSFGATPRFIFEDYQKWQLELEREPVQFISVNGPRYLAQSSEALGKFIGCDADDVVFVTNPSYAVNIIAKSLDLSEGDEILTTHLEYGACDKTWEYYCDKAKAKYIRQNISLPLSSKENFVEEFFKGATENTKLIFISHITSSTALIFPVKEIVARAKQLGIMTFVDGAHAPAHVELNIRELNADVYTGACHKWMMAPKGCSFLYVQKSLQEKFDPLIISWGYNAMFPSHSKFIDYHQGQGTRDFSAFLTVPACIDFMNNYNWTEVSRNCRALVKENAQRFCTLLNSQTLAPLTDEFIGQMLSFPINTTEPEKLQRYLFEKHLVEIPVMRHGTKNYLRYSINAFNSQNDLDRLYAALEDVIDNTTLITR